MDVVMPQLGETVAEGTVSAWHKAAGDRVTPDEPLFEVETEKVTTDVPAPAAGVLTEILVPVGDTVPVGTRLAVIRTAADEARPAPSAAGAAGPAAPARPPAPPHVTPPSSWAPVARDRDRDRRLSPVVRRLLAEHRLDPAAIAGTGAGGRVQRRDVLAFLSRAGDGTAAAPAAPPTDATVVPMGRVRRLTAAHMVRSVQTSPHVLQAVEVDFARVDAVRRAEGAAWRDRHGYSLTYLPFVAHATCRAIADFPHVNASVRGDALVVHHRVHLGIAVDLTGAGLVVPVVRDAHRRSLPDLARAIHALAERARSGALTPADVSGGTYTISNPGPFGTLFTAPIIHQPQVAILSTDGVRKRPIVVEGPGGDEIAVRPVGILAQCFDHRALDGAYSAGFLRRLKELLESHDWSTEITRAPAPTTPVE